MTKFEIIKAAYEAQFKSQKYDKSNMRHTYETLVESAMDEWAKQQSISFAEWVDEYELLLHSGIWKCRYPGIGDEKLTTAELYQLFTQHQSKQV